MRFQNFLLASCVLAAHASAISSEYDDDLKFLYDPGPWQTPVIQNHPHPPPGAPGPLRTVYELISGNPHFKKLTKALEFDSEITGLLNDTSAQITFFAVPDWALKRPKRHEHHDDFHALFDPATGNYDFDAVTAALSSIGVESKSDDDDKKRRRKFLKKILHAILSYHILLDASDKATLAANITYPTSLSLPDGSFDGKPLRIHVEKGPFASPLKINFVSAVTLSQSGSNGFAHTISHPLFPPPSIFQEAFLLHQAFSTYTSAIQRVQLTSAVDLRYIPGEDGKKGSNIGTPVATSFIPVNRAFERLPLKLRLFLFSPFGERILKKLLQYHTVPDLVVHSNYLYNSSSGEETNSFRTQSAWARDVDVFVGDGGAQSIASLLGHTSSYIHHHIAPHFGEAYAGRIPHAHSGRETFGVWHSPDDAPPRPRGHCGPLAPPPASLAPNIETVWAVNITVPTLLSNHTLDLHIAKFKVQIPLPGPHPPPAHFIHRFYVNGQRVALSDIPARNGAAHVLPKLISPRDKGKAPPSIFEPNNEWRGGNVDDDSEWNGWEEWLPKWADEN